MLTQSVDNLTLSSYSSINLYGTGTIGPLDPSGNPTIASLSLQAPAIVGLDNNGGTVTINAGNVTLGNETNQSFTGSTPSSSGILDINANTINFTANSLALDGFSGGVQLTANSYMEVSGTGAITTPGSLALITPEITGATGANYTFTAQGGELSLTPAHHHGNQHGQHGPRRFHCVPGTGRDAEQQGLRAVWHDHGYGDQRELGGAIAGGLGYQRLYRDFHQR